MAQERNASNSTGPEMSRLCSQYPEIKFSNAAELNETVPPQAGVGSSVAGEMTEATASGPSSSPRSRSSASSVEEEDDYTPERTAFMAQLNKSTLPEDRREWFGETADEIQELGNLIPPVMGEYVMLACEHLIVQQAQMLEVQAVNTEDRATKQVEKIKELIQTGPFTIDPDDDNLWLIYRQRASAITGSLDSLTRTEVDLIEGLTHLFNTIVYDEYLILSDAIVLDEDIVEAIEHAYHEFMLMVRSHKRWMRTLKALKRDYMDPLMRRILDSPVLRKQIQDDEEAQAALVAEMGAFKPTLFTAFEPTVFDGAGFGNLSEGSSPAESSSAESVSDDDDDDDDDEDNDDDDIDDEDDDDDDDDYDSSSTDTPDDIIPSIEEPDHEFEAATPPIPQMSRDRFHRAETV